MADNSIWNAGKGGSSGGGGSSGTSSIWGAGSSGKSSKKKVKGVLGGFDRAMSSATGGLLGALGNLLSAPQQVVYKAGQGIGDIATGHPGAGFKGLKGAAGEVLSLGQAGGDIDFATAAGRYDEASGKHLPTKLPFGVNTAVDVVADPLNFLTFGAGKAAKAASEVSKLELGAEAAERLAKQGFKKGLTDAEKTTLRETLVKNAEEAGSKNAAKTADKQIADLALRGRGGVTARIPGTHIGGTVPLLSGESVGKAADEIGLTAAKKAVKTSAPGQFLRRAFVPGAAVAERAGAKASEELLDAIGARSARQASQVEDLVTRWNSAVKDFEQTGGKGVKFGPAEDTFVHRALESGDLTAAKAERPELSRLIDTGDALRRETDSSLREAGVLAEGQGRDIDTFMHRELTPEASDALGKARRDALYEGKSLNGSMTPGSAKARVIAPDYRVEKIHEAIDTIQKGGIVADPALHDAVEGLAQKLPPGTKLYKESAVSSLISSGADAAKALSTAQLVNDVRAITDDAGEAILRSAEDVAAGSPVPHDWVEFKIPKLGTFHAPPEVKEELTKFMSVIGQDDVVGKFQKYINQWDRWWRGQVTASLPGGVPFASRNARSNVMLTFVDGMSPKYFQDGFSFQRKVAKVIEKNAAAIADEGVEAVMKRELGSDFKIWKAAREYGVIGDGFYNIDISDAPQIKAAGAPKTGGRLKRGVRFVAGSHGTLATKGRELNQIVEQHARMSHFLYSIDSLGDLEKAAARTNTVLFDYGKLTPFEQKVVKRVLPFYTFMRKNIPGQLRALVENPIRVIGPEKLSRAVSAPLPEDSPEYQKRSGAHVSILPGLAGLVTTPERPFQAAVTAVEPLAQLAAALIPGNQGAVEPGGGTPQAIRSLVSQVGGGPAALGKALFEEGTGKSSFTGYNLTPDERRQRLLAATYPSLGRAPTLSGRLPHAAVAQGTKNKAKLSTLAQLAALLGIKLETPSDGSSPSGGTAKSGGTSSIWGAGKK